MSQKPTFVASLWIFVPFVFQNPTTTAGPLSHRLRLNLVSIGVRAYACDLLFLS
jgi:hypothetical protein